MSHYLKKIHLRKAGYHVTVCCGAIAFLAVIMSYPLAQICSLFWDSSLRGEEAGVARLQQFILAAFCSVSAGTVLSLFFLYRGTGEKREKTKKVLSFVGCLIFLLIFRGLYITQGDIDRFFIKAYFEGNCRDFLSLSYSWREWLFLPVVLELAIVSFMYFNFSISLSFLLQFLFATAFFIYCELSLIAVPAFDFFCSIFITHEVIGRDYFVLYMKFNFFLLFPLTVMISYFVVKGCWRAKEFFQREWLSRNT